MRLAKLMFLAAFMLQVPQALAAGDAPAADTAAAMAKSAKALGCKKGEVAKAADNNACIAAAAGALPDDQLYEQGRLLADDGEYEWALDVLALITKQDDAKVQNYIGYSNRKAGRLETGIAAYQKALTLDANFVQAREYLGEAYILAGKVDLAKQQLEEIKTRKGEASPEYVALAKALADSGN